MRLYRVVPKCSKPRMDTHEQLALDLARAIGKDESNSSVTTDDDQNLSQYETFRERVEHVLESYKFQVVVITLVIVDCLLVIGELLIDIEMLELGQSDPGDAPKILHGISLGILCLFLIEIIAKIYAFRLDFFHRRMELFDAGVVVVSFTLDIAFNSKHNAVNGTGLVIILRLWRVGRILNSIVMSVKIQGDRKLLNERRRREALEQELTKYRDYCAMLEHDIDTLRSLLHSHSIAMPNTMESRPVSGTKVDVIAEVNEITIDSMSNSLHPGGDVI